MFLGISAAIPAFAGNSSDSYWHNEYRWNDPNDHTPARPKYDTSSYYNLTRRIDGVGYINIWAALYDGRDVSDGHYYSPSAGDETRLWNSAVENYGSGVSVRIDSSRYANGSASGLWSPDSV